MVVTLNLVDVALSSDGDMDKFWKIYDERLELCHKALLLRHEHLEGTFTFNCCFLSLELNNMTILLCAELILLCFCLCLHQQIQERLFLPTEMT